MHVVFLPVGLQDFLHVLFGTAEITFRDLITGTIDIAVCFVRELLDEALNHIDIFALAQRRGGKEKGEQSLPWHRQASPWVFVSV